MTLVVAAVNINGLREDDLDIVAVYVHHRGVDVLFINDVRRTNKELTRLKELLKAKLEKLD